MTRLTLRTTLTLIYTCILALLLVTLGIVYYEVLARHLDADATDDLEKMTGGLRGYIRVDAGSPVLAYDRNDPQEVTFIGEATRYFRISDANTGEPLEQSPAFAALGAGAVPADVWTHRDRALVYDVHTAQGRIRMSSSALTSNRGDAYLLQVGLPLDPIDGDLARFVRLLLWSLPVGLIVAVVTGRLMAGRALAPLARLAAATRAISVADLRRRLPVRGVNDELDEVADAFNDTLARLEQAVGEMRQFSAALAHELRTPLAALRGETELALVHGRSLDDYRRGLASQLEELDKLARLINQLLTLARAESGQIPLSRDPVDLASLGAAVVEQLEPVAQAVGLEMRFDAPAAAVVTGDQAWLQRLLLNMLDNAIKFTPAGGRIAVHVSRENGTARLDVSDTGVGIAPGALPHVFERFYRGEPDRSPHADGAGLGLALSKWIADRHGASLDVVSLPGKGSTFTVRLPLARCAATPWR